MGWTRIRERAGRSRRGRPVFLACLALAAAVWVYRGLALPARTLAATRAAVLYDLDGTDHPADALRRATSVPMPPGLFRQVASRASHSRGTALWKGSSLAVLELADGREVRLAVSYYGGFFAVAGQPGVYFVRPEDRPRWHQAFRRAIVERFITERHERNRRRGHGPGT